MSVLHAVNDRPRAEEQQRLEESVRHQVEDAGYHRAHAHRRHHKPQLRHGGIGQHFLDVKLRDGNGSGEHRRHRTQRPHDRLHFRDGLEQRFRSGNEIDAGGDHRRRVDQRRDRRRAGHRIGQPDVQRNLRALARDTNDQQQRDQHDQALRHFAVLDLLKNARELQRADSDEHGEHRQHHAPVADTIDDHRLLGRIAVGVLLEPETDQQERAQTHALPAHEQHQVVVRQHQDQHHRQEEIEIDEETLEARIAVHVADGVDMNQRAHAGDHHQHDARQPIDVQAHLDGRLTDREEGEQRHIEAVVEPNLFGRQAQQRDHHGQRDGKGQRGKEHRRPADDPLAALAAAEQVDQHSDERKNDDQPGVLKNLGDFTLDFVHKNSNSSVGHSLTR